MRRKIWAVIEDWYESDSHDALLIKGSRQVGKTYTITEFGRQRCPGHFIKIELSKEGPDRTAFERSTSIDDLIKQLSVIHRRFEFVPGNTLIFIDEIQQCAEAVASLKDFAIDGRYRVIASGSLLGLRMKKGVILPMGYVRIEKMEPMDFEEFLWANSMKQEAIDDVREHLSEFKPLDDTVFDVFSRLYTEYVSVGGMPKAVDRFVLEQRYTNLGWIYKEITDWYASDISNYADDSVKTRIEACIQAIPGMLASENKKFMYSKIKAGDEEAKQSAAGFSYFAEALDWLNLASITRTCNQIGEPCKPLENHVRTNAFKLYMLDTGILLSLYNDQIRTDIVMGNLDTNRGAIMENAVAEALAIQDRKLYYYTKDSPRAEIDFVTLMNGRVACIEVKSGSNRTCRSLNGMMSTYDIDGVMFETRNIFQDQKGIRHYPLFAASFMDAIDHSTLPEVDHSYLEGFIDEPPGTDRCAV